MESARGRSVLAVWVVVGEVREMNTITLIPLAIRKPGGGYTLSKNREPKRVTMEYFLTRFADNPRVITVSIDGHTKPITAYGFGLDCWWIV